MVHRHGYKLFFVAVSAASFVVLLSSTPADERASGPTSGRRRQDDSDAASLLDSIFGEPKRDDARNRTSAGTLPSTPATPEGLLQAVSGLASKVIDVADDQLPEVPPRTSLSLGRRYRDTLVEKHGLLSDATRGRRVTAIWKELLSAASLPHDEFVLTLTNDTAVNAFAFIGNNVVVTKGFLDFTEASGHRDDMIRFVLAHELGHIVLKHTEKPFRRVAFADGVLPGSGMAPHVLSKLIGESALNQSNEVACDCFARKLLLDNGWSTAGGVEFFQRVKTLPPSEGDTVFAALFMSHPDHAKRVDNISTGRFCQ